MYMTVSLGCGIIICVLLLLSCLVYLALSVICVSQAAVLDPALYLSPSPPLFGESGADRWSEIVVEPSTEPALVEEQEHLESIEDEPGVPQARTFWPLQPSYVTRGVHIPLTFSLTGSYGNTGISTGIIGSSYTNTGIGNIGIPSGVIGSSYASISDYGKSGLAGSSYGLYRSGPGTRVYGGGGGAAWSGWGNGKWGHYGKG